MSITVIFPRRPIRSPASRLSAVRLRSPWPTSHVHGLPQLQIQLEQYDQALATLNVPSFPSQFTAAVVDELRGDALAMQGKKDEAIA